MFSNFSEEAKKVLIMSKKEMNELKHSYIGTEHFFLALLKTPNSKVNSMLSKYQINYNNFKKAIIKLVGYGNDTNIWFLYTTLLKRILEEAIIISKEYNCKYVDVNHILIALLEEGDGVALRALSFMNIDVDSLLDELCNNDSFKSQKKSSKLILEEYGYLLNDYAQSGKIDPVIGRDKEIDRIIEILCRRTKNNPLLIGEAGVGKTAVVEELSKRIVEGNVPLKIKNKKIYSISMASLVAGTKYRGEFEDRINKMLSEIEEYDNIIIFIDEIHTLVGAGGADGAIDASNILKPFLARGKIKLIGATTIDEYKKYLENDRALERRFQTILIKEPDDTTLLNILKRIKPLYESYHNVLISDDVLNTIIKLSNKYIYNRKQPDKAIDILDEVCSKISIKKNKNEIQVQQLNYELNQIQELKNESIISQNFKKASDLCKKENQICSTINELSFKCKSNKKRKVTNNAVAQIIKSKTNTPIFEYLFEDFKKINKLESILSNLVIGQEKVIKQISDSIKLAKFGYKDNNKPLSFLFSGPTGVGKTTLAKILSEIVSGGDLIRLDMSEFKEPHSVSKIIGSPPGYVGYNSKNTILDEVKIKPNAIILLDEIEKAHSNVINLFFQILDEGFIKNTNNEIIRFDNNIIIMTTNIGFNKVEIGFNSNKEAYVIDSLKNILSVEMINRIDNILVFENLTEQNIKRIIKKEYNTIINDFHNTNKKYKLSEKDLKTIILKSQYSEYGARKLKKIIYEVINNTLIKEKTSKDVKITIETI